MLPESCSDHPACLVWQEVAELAKEMLDHPIVPKLAQIKAIYQYQEHSGGTGTVHIRLDHLENLIKSEHKAAHQDIENVNRKVAIIHNDLNNRQKIDQSRKRGRSKSRSKSSGESSNRATAAKLMATSKHSSTSKNKGHAKTNVEGTAKENREANVEESANHSAKESVKGNAKKGVKGNTKQSDKSIAWLNTKVDSKGGNQGNVENDAMVVSENDDENDIEYDSEDDSKGVSEDVNKE
ncbi:hypothetical protein ACHAPX_002602 [Trichoderma viride]